MEALILSSRSIVQDKCFEKEMKKKYRKHLDHIGLITRQQGLGIEDWGRQTQNIAKSLKKSKTAVKLFREKQQKQQLKCQNMHLLKKIWQVEPAISTYHNDNLPNLTGSNFCLRKKQMESIKNQNLMFLDKITGIRGQTGIKLKIKQQIQDYIKLRDSIRKFKRTHSTISPKKKIHHKQPNKEKEIRSKNPTLPNLNPQAKEPREEANNPKI